MRATHVDASSHICAAVRSLGGEWQTNVMFTGAEAMGQHRGQQ